MGAGKGKERIARSRICFGLEKKIKKLEKFLRHIIRKLRLLCSKNEVGIKSLK